MSTIDPAEDLMDRLNDYSKYSAEALLLGEDAPDGARGRVRVHAVGDPGEEFADTLVDNADHATSCDVMVEEIEAGVADLWMYAQE